MDYILLGKILSESRKKTDFTQSDIASKLNVTAQNVSSWERGKSKIDIETFMSLCELYQLDFKDALSIASGSVSTITEEVTLEDDTIQKYHRLNDDGKKKAGEYISDLEQMPKYQLQTDEARKLKEVAEAIGTIIRTTNEMEAADLESGVQIKK